MCVSKWSEQSCFGYFAGAQSPWKASAAVEQLNFKSQYVVHAGETEMRERSRIHLAATTAAHWYSACSPKMSMHNTFWVQVFSAQTICFPYFNVLLFKGSGNLFPQSDLRSHEQKILEEQNSNSIHYFTWWMFAFFLLFCLFHSLVWSGGVNQFENTVVTYFTMFTSTVVVALSIKTHTIPIEVLNVKILTNTT